MVDSYQCCSPNSITHSQDNSVKENEHKLIEMAILFNIQFQPNGSCADWKARYSFLLIRYFQIVVFFTK